MGNTINIPDISKYKVLAISTGYGTQLAYNTGSTIVAWMNYSFSESSGNKGIHMASLTLKLVGDAVTYNVSCGAEFAQNSYGNNVIINNANPVVTHIVGLI